MVTPDPSPPPKFTAGEIRIGDLGLSRTKEEETQSTLAGTPAFMAPEFYAEAYDEKVDIYALGMCALEMATKEYPYSECTSIVEIMRTVISGTLPRSLRKVQGNPLAVRFITRCLARDPAMRPTALEVDLDMFFQVCGGKP